MQMNFEQWAIKHQVSVEAVNELIKLLTSNTTMVTDLKTEVDVKNKLRCDMSLAGGRLWNNPRGAGFLESGNYLRYGLANDSPALNVHLKSSDLVGIKPVLVTQGMVGTTLGQFVSYEAKKPGWKYMGTPHEHAQMNWHILINALGGMSGFSTGDL